MTTQQITTLQSYLCGEWRVGVGGEASLVNPATGDVVATVATKFAPETLHAALAYGRDVGGAALRKMNFAERGALLKRMSNALHEAREELVDASQKNNGATRGDAKFDVDGAIGTLAYYAKLGSELGAKHGDKTFLIEGAAEPLTRAPRFCGYHMWTTRPGVALHINAFNFPAWGLAEKAAVSILAGVPFITKPATSTALTAYLLIQKLVEKAELPAGAVQLICGSVSDLCDHLLPEDAIAFTGSADTGSRLRQSRACIERSTRINVEADSLNAVVVGEDVVEGSDTWHMVVRHLLTEMTQKSGQKCTASRRIFAPRATIDALQAALAEKLGAIRVGNPVEEGVDMGPLATAQQLADAHKGIGLLQSDGAQIVAGTLENPVGKGFFLKPVLLRHNEPTTAKAVHAHEVFGPVSTLMPYSSPAEAAALVARGEGTLVCSVYSDDKGFLEQVLFAAATWTGRMLVGSEKVADQAITPGMVLPSCIHGGPGRAGGGEELGGERGLRFYMQRTAIQGDRALLDRVFGVKADA
jgi:3,4-dehydroadipyl-CoA semialdehyde dehydrogenase